MKLYSFFSLQNYYFSSDFPQKFQLVEDPILASWGIRFVIINNYLAFYTIDERKQIVTIVRFLYQKSNWNSILRQGFSLK